MYQAIEQHTEQFKNLKAVLSAQNADASAAQLRRALEDSAEALNAQADGSAADRDARARIYRGLFAASRIVAQLREAAMNS